MRRFVTVVLALGIAATLVATASARTLRVRTDRDEPHGRPDIRKVWTDGSPEVFVRIATWDRLQRDERHFVVKLDTRGSRDYERAIEIFNHDGNVWKIDDRGSFQELLGQRRVHMINPRTLAFSGPRGWFDITRPVRFVVTARDPNARREDRAPNDGRYIRL
jgi:hypothetical protein